MDAAREPFDEGSADRIDKALAIHADNTPRRLQILEYVAGLAQDPTALILYFGPSVRDAEAMAYMIRSTTSLNAAVISAETRESTRRAIVEDFKRQRIRVLCNCEVLTTGFDAPLVTHVIIGRPTVSRVLYEQMAGRALRGPKFGGTERAHIVDCVDGFRGPRPRLGYQQFRAVWKPELADHTR
jgi:DNA repair protein RadD